jgi:hypothetical protein
MPLFFIEHLYHEKLENKTIATIVIITLIAVIGTTAISMNGNAFAQPDNLKNPPSTVIQHISHST